MKRILTVAAFTLGAAVAPLGLAQSPAPVDVPKHKCQPKPELPGAKLMEEASVRKRFQSDLDNYKKCMKEYSDARNSMAKAHIDAANEAINEYNATIKALQDAQKAQ